MVNDFKIITLMTYTSVIILKLRLSFILNPPDLYSKSHC